MCQYQLINNYLNTNINYKKRVIKFVKILFLKFQLFMINTRMWRLNKVIIFKIDANKFLRVKIIKELLFEVLEEKDLLYTDTFIKILKIDSKVPNFFHYLFEKHD